MIIKVALNLNQYKRPRKWAGFLRDSIFSTSCCWKYSSTCSILQTLPWHDLSVSAVKHRPVLPPDIEGHFEIKLSAATSPSIAAPRFHTMWPRVFYFLCLGKLLACAEAEGVTRDIRYCRAACYNDLLSSNNGSNLPLT